MIIVKTSNGDVFINDSEMLKLTHDRSNHFAYVTMKKQGSDVFGMAIRPIEMVETVIYVNDATDKERRDDGSELKFLRQQLADEKSMCGFMHTIARKLERHLIDFASDIIQVVQYGDQIPADVRKRIRDLAEDSKKYALDDSKWWERRQFEEMHEQKAKEEAARTAELNEKVEHQAAQIFSLQQQLEQAKAKEKYDESEIKMLRERKEEILNRNLWQRIINAE